MQYIYQRWALFEALAPAGSSPAGQEMRWAEVGHPGLEHSLRFFGALPLPTMLVMTLGKLINLSTPAWKKKKEQMTCETL